MIRAVEELEERPIEEHVGVFESAQVQLRRALDDRGDAATRRTTTPATPEPEPETRQCHHAGCGWTPSSYAGGSRGRGSTLPTW